MPGSKRVEEGEKVVFALSGTAPAAVIGFFILGNLSDLPVDTALCLRLLRFLLSFFTITDRSASLDENLSLALELVFSYLGWTRISAFSSCLSTKLSYSERKGVVLTKSTLSRFEWPPCLLGVIF